MRKWWKISLEKILKGGEIWHKSRNRGEASGRNHLEELKEHSDSGKKACEEAKFLGRVYSRRRGSLRVLDYAELSRKTKESEGTWIDPLFVKSSTATQMIQGFHDKPWLMMGSFICNAMEMEENPHLIQLRNWHLSLHSLPCRIC